MSDTNLARATTLPGREAIDPLAPYDAIMLVSYGGPYQPADVLPFMRNATRGRGVPDERLVEVSGHYQQFGGASPINERNEELRVAIEERLRKRGSQIPVSIGNRNWKPFIKDTLGELLAAGSRRIMVVLTSAYASYSGCRQYREDLGEALRELRSEDARAGELQLDKVRPYFTTPGFIAAATDAAIDAIIDLAALGATTSLRHIAGMGKTTNASEPGIRIAAYHTPGKDEPAAIEPIGLDARLVFVTHSIPTAMDEASGPVGGEVSSPVTHTTYQGQHLAVAREISRRLDDHFGTHIPWDLVYCSRSGPPFQPWLEPDINDHLKALAAAGIRGVVAAPIGFVSDHMEVVFDLDTEAAETATEVELDYVRARTVGIDERFIDSLEQVIYERAEIARSGQAIAETDDLGPWPATCRAGCCRQRPAHSVPARDGNPARRHTQRNVPPRQTVCGED
ncbi:MAG: ferrochelatase [Bowdeniella nasicola]|nr:ferrochelatase [Bowdeniella nasicola]